MNDGYQVGGMCAVGWVERRISRLCNLMSHIITGIVNCLMRSTWVTVRNINQFVSMENYLQQVSRKLVRAAI